MIAETEEWTKSLVAAGKREIVMSERETLMTEREADERLIESCRRGDREAFRILFETHKDKVYSVTLYFFGGDEALAADATQQVFLKLFTRIGQFRHDAEFTTWLHRLAVNVCLDEHRRRRRFIPFGEAFGVDEPRVKKSPEEIVGRGEAEVSIRDAIATLKPKLRVAILLKYFEELSYEEIASAMNCSKGTVASRLNRGHKILARRLGHLRASLFRGE